jgi:hypothetical protein
MTPVYDFFRDQGSFLAGIVALIAGVLAYLAGYIQASATRKAADQAHADHQEQMIAIERQAALAKGEAE